MADLKEVNGKIVDSITAGYNKIESGVVEGYRKVESGVVDGFTKMTDQFVGKFLTKEGETLEDAKSRLAENQKTREEAQKARIEASLEASRNAGKRN